MSKSVSYADLVALLGEAPALSLCKRRGGRSLYVPLPGRLGPRTPVVQLVGPAGAEALSLRFGPAVIDLPLSQGKRARVWELREGGMTIEQIAGELNYTARNVYLVLAQPRPKALDAREEEEPPLLAYIAKR